MIGYNMKRMAFTMIELVLVIVVLGILAALAMPRLDRDLQQEAADTILSNIRYTQHLALTDDKHRFNDPTWQRDFWKISFAADGSNFSISSGTNFALDPSNGLLMDGTASGSKNTQLSKKFGVTAFTASGICAGINVIGFDHLGRPHNNFSASSMPNYASYYIPPNTNGNDPCILTFTMSNGPALVIDIKPETGYAYIADQLGS